MLSVTLSVLETVTSEGIAMSCKSASTRDISLRRPPLVGTKRTDGAEATSEMGIPVLKVAVMEVSESIVADELSTPLKSTMTS